MGIFIDPADLPSGVGGSVQLLFLLFTYGYILSKSSGLISDGSELLLLIPSLAGIVGSVVLPVLGAVPDGAIVLFSGFGPKEKVQEQLSVGVGALAGSTIMLLTIPWALCIIMGRVNIVSGEAFYKAKPSARLTNGFSLFRSGVTPRNSIKINGIIMMSTSLAYFIIQGAATGARCDFQKNEHCKESGEHWWSLAALIVCVIAFAGYLYYNIKHADDEDKEDVIAEVRKQAIESHIVSLSVAFEEELKGFSSSASHLLSKEDSEKKINSALRSFFHKYDKDGNNVIDPYELKFLLHDVGEDMPDDKFEVFLKQIDSDASGSISFPEFAAAMRGFLKSKGEFSSSMPNSPYFASSANTQEQSLDRIDHHKVEKEEGDEEEEEEEEEEVPEDLASLPPDKQKLRILLRSAWMMGLGTAIVLLFSDPMVDVLSELGTRWKIGGFYTAFVLAPLASNASELIASIAYAQKKTKKTITISLSALEGAACMNNTFCLAIFLCLIFFRGLAWEFSAETISIIFVELALFLFTFFRKTFVVLDGILIFGLYPISILIVLFLEKIAGLN